MNSCPALINTFFGILFFFLTAGCNKSNEVHSAVYYWQSNFELDEPKLNYLKNSDINRIYLRMFDITWNRQYLKSKPEAVVRFGSEFPKHIELVPVIYIANDVFRQEKNIDELAKNLSHLLLSISDNNQLVFSEIQIDCDWTIATKEKFFNFLKLLCNYYPDKVLSATIRLHQVKYPEKTGVPPVDRGMLMFYNIGNIDSLNNSNSIFNESDAKKYINSVHQYALPLDVALPAYSWAIHFRNGKVKGLLNDMTHDVFRQCGAFTSINEMYWKADSSFFFKSNYFITDDVVKVEEISAEITSFAAQMLAPQLKTKTFHVSLFAFNQSMCEKYEKRHFDKIYSAFK